MLPHLFSASAHLQPSFSNMALKADTHALHGLKGRSQCTKTYNGILSFKPNGVYQNSRPKVLNAMNMTAGQSGNSGKINLDHIIDKARKLWDSSPQPVKSFPWNRALENFILLILDLILAVIKYLCVPVLAVSSLSEMSYCAHEKKLFLVPVPLLIGVAVAGVLQQTALELSSLLKDAEVPWHLIAIAIFFTLLKLPGPYYPYWGRIFIPHFANGGLLRTLWFAFLWFRRPRKLSETTLPQIS
uniref:Embryo defective 1273 n=1 Tax=Davidia involucrata TaxID=16924 RepID=A0A5B7C3R9_DAVIN